MLSEDFPVVLNLLFSHCEDAYAMDSCVYYKAWRVYCAYVTDKVNTFCLIVASGQLHNQILETLLWRKVWSTAMSEQVYQWKNSLKSF